MFSNFNFVPAQRPIGIVPEHEPQGPEFAFNDEVIVTTGDGLENVLGRITTAAYGYNGGMGPRFTVTTDDNGTIEDLPPARLKSFDPTRPAVLQL